MAIQHISNLSADDFRGAIGETFQVPAPDGIRMWTLRNVYTHTPILAPKCRSCGEGEALPPKPKMDKRTQTKLAKAAIAEINANLDAIGYTGPKVKKPVHTVTVGFEGELGKDTLPEGDYSLFHEGLGTIEGACVSHTVRPMDAQIDSAPYYDVTFNVT